MSSDLNPLVSKAQGPSEASSGSALAPYLDTPLRLFLSDPSLLKTIAMVVPRLGFQNVSVVKVETNYFEAIRQLFSEVMSFEGIILVNHPPQRIKGSGGRLYIDPNFADFYGGVASLIKGTSSDPTKVLQKCVPVFIAPQDPDVRQSFLQDLLPYGIVGAFMMRANMTGVAMDIQMEERVQELHFYFLEYFMYRQNKLDQLREYKSAEELKNRKAEAKLLMNEVERLKAAREFDKAVALCRKAIEVLPSDPEPYLEGGRLLVKKKKYMPAMQMFRDAEAVAQELPTPNQEIANLRMAQIKDHVETRRAAGQSIDREAIEGYLGDVVENFSTAISKAEKIKALDKDAQKARQKGAVGGVLESMLTGGLVEMLGTDNEQVKALMSMAQDTLDRQSAGTDDIPPQYLVHFGLMAFFKGDYERAEAEFLKAASIDETYHDACAKLNYMGTQLRQRGELDRAVRTYNRLLELEPPFLGVALFNLAVALQTRGYHQRAAGEQEEVADLERTAFGRAVEALMHDPELLTQDNFYHNTVMAPLFIKGRTLFQKTCQQSTQIEDPTQQACLMARDKLVALLKENKMGEAIQMLMSLAQKLKPFFLDFDKHASEEVMAFTERLCPILLKRPEPRMQTLGKILQVLLKKGRQPDSTAALADHPQIGQVVRMLDVGEKGPAFRELASAVFSHPDLAQDRDLLANRTVMDLVWQVSQLLEQVQVERFAMAGAAGKPAH